MQASLAKKSQTLNPCAYKNLFNNIKDISENCGFGNYYKLLDYEKGYCFGLTHMWGQAVLANDLKTYYDRLGLLTRNYTTHPLKGHKQRPEFKSLSSLLNYILKKHSRYKSTDKKKHLLAPDFKETKNPITNDKERYIVSLFFSIRTFLDGLLLYQVSEKTNLYKLNKKNHRVDKKLAWQNALASSKYVANAKIAPIPLPEKKIKEEKKSSYEGQTLCAGFKKVAKFPYLGDKGGYAKLLYFINHTKSQTGNPFFVEIGSIDHSIGLAGIPNSAGLMIYDANFMLIPVHKNQAPLSRKYYCQEACPDTLSSLLFSIFKHPKNKGPLALNFIIYEKIKNEYNDSQFRKLENFAKHHILQLMKQGGYTDKLYSISQYYQHEQIAEEIAEHKLDQNLYEAYKKNNHQETQKLLENGASLEEALLIAYRNNDKKTIERMNDNLPNYNYLYYLACAKGPAEITIKLKTQEGFKKIDLNQALIFACADNNQIAINALIKQDKVNIQHAFYLACAHKDFEAGPILQQYGGTARGALVFARLYKNEFIIQQLSKIVVMQPRPRPRKKQRLREYSL